MQKPITKAQKIAKEEAAKKIQENKETFKKILNESIPDGCEFLSVNEVHFSNQLRYRLKYGANRLDSIDGEIEIGGQIPDWTQLISQEKAYRKLRYQEEKQAQELKEKLSSEFESMLPSHLLLGIGNYNPTTGHFVVTYLGGQLQGYWKQGDPVPDWDNLEPYVVTPHFRSKLAGQMESAVGWARGD